MSAEAISHAASQMARTDGVEWDMGSTYGANFDGATAQATFEGDFEAIGFEAGILE